MYVCMQSLLITVRVMDDVKDYDLDVKIHPERPLPRGLLAYDEVVLVIKLTLAGLLGYACLMGARFGANVGWFFAFLVSGGRRVRVERSGDEEEKGGVEAVFLPEF